MLNIKSDFILIKKGIIVSTVPVQYMTRRSNQIISMSTMQETEDTESPPISASKPASLDDVDTARSNQTNRGLESDNKYVEICQAVTNTMA